MVSVRASAKSMSSLLASSSSFSPSPLPSMHSLLLRTSRPNTTSTGTTGSSNLFQAALSEAEQKKDVTESQKSESSTSSNTASSSTDSSTQLRTLTFKSPRFRTSPWKANLVAKVIRELPLVAAMDQMRFSKKRASLKVSALLNRAVDRIEKQHGSDRSHWIVKESFVGKGQYLKRIKLHGRGRFGVMHHPSSHVKVVLQELPKSRWNETESEAAARKEFEAIRHIFRRHKLYDQLKDSQPIRASQPPWASKPYKYITSPKWLDPNTAKSKQM
ncbi:54S ribosomal protein L22, mitochondrial [Blyttiomyces sp. JEL0837]|nr:54S ribosomal protein L22, mitochondrial [Blyttiomyces sp. JEL0837]